MNTEEIKQHNIFNEIDHYNRKGVLSDYWYGYLTALKENDLENKVYTSIKRKILEDMLLNSLKRKVGFDPYVQITSFYAQNSRGDFHEIKRYKKMYPEILRLIPLFDSGLKVKGVIYDKYVEIREKLERKGDWSLYHVLIDSDFQSFLKYLEITLKISIQPNLYEGQKNEL